MRKKTLVLRDALYRGRTNTICLYYKPQPTEQIHYYDFTSLYPFVNKTKQYPVGHPIIVYGDSGDINCTLALPKLKCTLQEACISPFYCTESGVN